MLRFTIRDVLWLTVVVALAVAWRIDHSRLATDAANWRYFISTNAPMLIRPPRKH